MRKYLAVMLITGIISCANADKKVAGSSDSTSKNNVSINDVELKDNKVQAIYDGYISLKNALVNTKLADAQNAAKQLKLNLANYKGCENTALIADKIASARNIADQRKEFTALSADVMAMFKHADLKKGSIYIQHCPMANHGDGGDWLSSERKIQNPYYGDKMMECGAVLEEIKPGK